MASRLRDRKIKNLGLLIKLFEGTRAEDGHAFYTETLLERS